MKKFKKLIIACDGESASGKSTAAKLIAKKYKLVLDNSGLLYRYGSKQIIKNILLFALPFFAFETFRVIIGAVKGPQYGVRYVHAAEAENQQFVWVLKSIFSNSYEPAQACHTLNKFILRR